MYRKRVVGRLGARYQRRRAYLAELTHAQNKEDFNVGLVGSRQQEAWRGVPVSVVASGSPSHRVEAVPSGVLAVVAHGSGVLGESAVGDDLSHFRQYLVSRIEKNPYDNSMARLIRFRSRRLRHAASESPVAIRLRTHCCGLHGQPCRFARTVGWLEYPPAK
jgi:hypothetical protein